MKKVWVFIENTIRFLLIRVFRLKISEKNLEKMFQFVQFGIVGISNTLISYIVYIILVSIGFYYLIASFIGFLISVLNAFYWNNKYVFKSREGEKRALGEAFVKTFVSYAGTGLVLNNILLIIWVDIFKINEMIAPIVNLFITIPLNFLLNKFWTFRTSKGCEEVDNQERKVQI